MNNLLIREALKSSITSEGLYFSIHKVLDRESDNLLRSIVDFTPTDQVYSLARDLFSLALLPERIDIPLPRQAHSNLSTNFDVLEVSEAIRPPLIHPSKIQVKFVKVHFKTIQGYSRTKTFFSFDKAARFARFGREAYEQNVKVELCVS